MTHRKSHVQRFVLYQDGAGHWRWSAYAMNNRVLADSGESYGSRATALARLKALRGDADTMPIFERNPDGPDPDVTSE